MDSQAHTTLAGETGNLPQIDLLLQHALDHALAFFGASLGVLALMDGSEGHLKLLCQRGLSRRQRIHLEGAIRRQEEDLLTQREPFVTTEGFGGEAKDALWSHLRIWGLLVVPLWDEMRLCGAMFIGLPDPLSLDQALLDHLRGIADPVILIAQLEAQLRQAQRQLEESQALLRISQILAQPTPTDEMLAAIVQKATESIRSAYAGVIHLLASDGETLVPMGVFRGFLPRASQIKMRLGVGIAGESLQQGQAIRVDDVTQEPRFVVGPTAPSYRSLLVAPMTAGGDKVGTLSVQSDRPGAFTADDERFLTILAGQAAMVVANSRLLAELHQRLDELRRTQSYLVRAEKLAATGRLAASIAHEINNPLEGIKNFLALLERRFPPENPNRELLHLVGAGFERIHNTVNQLLSFSREQEAAYHPCNLGEVVESALALVRNHLLSHDISVQVDLDADLPLVLASPHQIERVFLNLFLNAADAMEVPGGTLKIRGRKEGERVCVSIEDSGPGIPEEVRGRLFEPFVTTKRHGAGLGLWVCYGIISEHGGQIEVESEASRGTVFTITLPALSSRGTGQAPHLT